MRSIQQKQRSGLAPAQTAPQGADAPLTRDHWDRRLGDAFRALVTEEGVRARTSQHAGRHRFDNVFSRRAWPWRAITLSFILAAAAGASLDRLLAFCDELRAFALSLYPDRVDEDLARALLDETTVEADANPLQAEVLAGAARGHVPTHLLEDLVARTDRHRRHSEVLARTARKELAKRSAQRLTLVPS